MSPRHRLVIAVLVISMAPGCIDALTEGDAVVQILRSVVYGRVLSEAGTAASGARIVLRPDPNGQCPAQQQHSPSVAEVQTSTGADGTFRAEVVLSAGAGVTLETSCVRLDITPPTSAGLRDTSVSVGPVRFTRVLTDSVRADIVLQIQ
jgi:hypothetical protein